jgi:hypothetical protein
MEFSHPLDQSGQVRGHLRLALLVLDICKEQKLVHPLCRNVHINQDPPLLGILLASPESNIDVLLSMVGVQRQPDPEVNHFVLSGQGIVIPE